MSQQALDLRRSVPDRASAQGPRRRRGGSRPPHRRCLRRAQTADAHQYRARRAPAICASCAERPAAGTGATDSYTATQEVIAGSNQVLSRALPDVRPAMSLNELRSDVQIGSLTPSIISVSAKGKVAADAEATANAVAESYISYVGSASSPVGALSARIA